MFVWRGQTADFYLREVRGIHGPVRGKYKIPFPEARAQYLAEIRNAKPDTEHLISARFLSKWLTEWNLTYPADYATVELRGKPIPFSIEVMTKECYAPTFIKLVNIVSGYSESDVDPEATAEKQIATVDRQAMTPEELLQQWAKEDAETVGN